MKIFLTIFILNFILYIVKSQNNDHINRQLLKAEYNIWNSEDSVFIANELLTKSDLLFQNGRFQEALAELNRINIYNENEFNYNDLCYRKSVTSFLALYYSDTYNLLIKIPDSVRISKTEYGRIWLLTLNELGLWKKCKRDLLMYAKTLEDSLKIEELPEEPYLISLDKVRRLSSFIPGSGQIYTGHLLKGITSFSLNVLTGSIAVVAIVNGFYVAGFVYGIYPLYRFYFGGKRYSLKLTSDKNRQIIDSLKKDYALIIVSLTDKP